MVTVSYDDHFCKVISNLDNTYKLRVKKQIRKIVSNPVIGKPMRHNRKGTREVYVSPFRLSYVYEEQKDFIVFLAENPFAFASSLFSSLMS